MIGFSADNLFLVTGASSGFGAATAILLNSLGAKVIGSGRDTAKLEQTKDACANPEYFVPATFDLSDKSGAIDAWVKALRETHGTLSGLVHCAGVLGGILPIGQQRADALRDLFEINAVAAHQLARAVLDRRNNKGEGTSLVFLASTGAMRDSAAISGYAMSKGAIIAMTRSLALEFAVRKIRVNCLSPGMIVTPMTLEHYPDARERAQAAPLGEGSAEDVAAAAAFLLSEASRWMTGQNIVLDGGRGLM